MQIYSCETKEITTKRRKRKRKNKEKLFLWLSLVWHIPRAFCWFPFIDIIDLSFIGNEAGTCGLQRCHQLIAAPQQESVPNEAEENKNEGQGSCQGSLQLQEYAGILTL